MCDSFLSEDAERKDASSRERRVLERMQMADSRSLLAAKNAKNDEFYTQYQDIEAEMSAYVGFNKGVFRDKTILCPCDDPEWSNFTKYFLTNFRRFGLKKLICTSYAKGAWSKHEEHGKLFTLTRDADGSGNVDMDDVEFIGYLEGDGDFRSEEVTALRDEADIIITNPPFSLFRPFLAWIMEANKQFIIIGNQNAVTYKEVFPLLKDNKMWYGYSIHSGDRKFNVPDEYPLEAAGCGVDIDGKKYIRVKGVRWFTNIDHGGRHERLQLMTMRENLKFNKKLRKKFENEYGKLEYPHYDNYDAIEVPFTDAIPSDYKPCWFDCDKAQSCQYAMTKGNGEALCEQNCNGVMGVPITYLDKHNSDQYRIVGLDRYTVPKEDLIGGRVGINGRPCYARVLIQKCNGVMGVPITYLDKHDYLQFEIIGCSDNGAVGEEYKLLHFKRHNEPYVNGNKAYKRLFIRAKGGTA
jgi:hypothetical protein